MERTHGDTCVYSYNLIRAASSITYNYIYFQTFKYLFFCEHRPALKQKRPHVSGLPQEAVSSRAASAEADGSSAGRRCSQRASARPVPGTPPRLGAAGGADIFPPQDSKPRAAGSVRSPTRGTRARRRRPQGGSSTTAAATTASAPQRGNSAPALGREPRREPTAPAAQGLQPHAPGRRPTATRPQRRYLRNAAPPPPPQGGSRPRGAGPAAFAQSRGAGRRCAALRAHHAAGGGGDLASGTPPTPWLPPTPLPATFAPTPATGRAPPSSQRDGRSGAGLTRLCGAAPRGWSCRPQREAPRSSAPGPLGGAGLGPVVRLSAIRPGLGADFRFSAVCVSACRAVGVNALRETKYKSDLLSVCGV